MSLRKLKNFLIALFAVTLCSSGVMGGYALSLRSDADTVINPIAKYEFKDSANPGKDSMGNYDLVKQQKNGAAAGSGTIAIADGVATFDGTAGLNSPSKEADISENLTSFTMVFEVKTAKTNTDWASPISFGWDNWTASKWASFQFSPNSDLLRFTAANSRVDGSDGTVSDIDGNKNRDWGKEIGPVSDTFHKVTLSAQLGGNITVYLDNVKKYDYALPENFSLKNDTMRFAIGSESVWGNLYSVFNGSIKNVQIYDFAMNATEGAAFWTDGQLTASEMRKAVSSTSNFSDSIIVEEAATDEDILKLAPASSLVNVVMSDDATLKGVAVWDGVEVKDGKKYITGKLDGVFNPSDVKAYALIGVMKEAKAIVPIAKYEFKDAANPGKDSMGNFDLMVNDKVDGVATGGTVAVSNGVATFNGKAALTHKNNTADITEQLSSFTLYFEIQLPTNPTKWASPIGFGWNDWNPTRWATFQFAGGSDLLRFSSATKLVDGSSDIDGHGNANWGFEIGNTGNTAYHKVALTAQEGGNITVYFDNVNKYQKALPENFSFADKDMMFAIGGESVWGNVYNAFSGNMKNVSIYDFALTEGQVKALGDTGELKTNSLVGQTYIESADAATLAFENDTVLKSELFDNMTQAQMIAAMSKATVEATLSDGSKKSIPIIFTSVTKSGAVWTAYGHMQVAGVGKPTAIAEKIAVSQVVEVTPSYQLTVGELQNGKVKLSKEYGVTGDKIEITPTPNAHYEVDKVFAGAVEIAKDSEGKYIFTVGTSDEVITATFKSIMYTVTAGELSHGALSFSPSSAAFGTVITITATPDRHYVLSKVFVDGVEIQREGANYTFKIQKDSVVTATFAAAVYSIDSFVTGGHGSISTDKATAAGGETVVITVTPDEGYAVDYVKANGTAITAVSGVYSFAVDGDVEFEVKYKAIYSISSSVSGGHGSISTDKATAASGETVIITVTPDKDYEVDYVKANGTAITADSNGVYSYVVQGDVAFEVKYKAKAASPGGDGEEKKGCGSSIGYSMGAMAILIAMVGVLSIAIFRKKRE